MNVERTCYFAQSAKCPIYLVNSIFDNELFLTSNLPADLLLYTDCKSETDNKI